MDTGRRQLETEAHDARRSGEDDAGAKTKTQLPLEQYRLLVEHSPMLIWRTRRDGRCDYVNDVWLQFTGRALAQEVGDGWAEGVHRDDVARCLETYRSSSERRQAFEREYRLRRHDGVYCYMLDRGVPFFAEDGSVAGYIGSCVDVNGRREAERDNALCMSTLAHQQRTPLQAMKMFIEVMRRRSARGEIIGPEQYDRMNAQIDHSAKLISDLAEVVRKAAVSPFRPSSSRA